MNTTRTPTPIGTNQHPYTRVLPFNPDNPFGSGSCGVLCNSGSVADPTAATQRWAVSPGTYQPNANAPAADLWPVANPTNLKTGNYWLDMFLEPADSVIIKPYMVLFSDNTYAALASAAAGGGIAATLSFFAVFQGRPPQTNEPMEYSIEFKGSAVLANAATRVSSSTRYLPTGAQWAQAATITNAAIDPGITADDTDISTGALRLRFDQEGAVGLLTYVSSLTSNAGCGWLRRHI